MVWSAMSCENPRHKEHVKNFVKGFPTAKGRVPDTIIMVDPNNWYISDIPKFNTVPCCQTDLLYQ
jgi:formylmethanofuran dehydrogenase subunit B